MCRRCHLYTFPSLSNALSDTHVLWINSVLIWWLFILYRSVSLKYSVYHNHFTTSITSTISDFKNFYASICEPYLLLFPVRYRIQVGVLVNRRISNTKLFLKKRRFYIFTFIVHDLRINRFKQIPGYFTKDWNRDLTSLATAIMTLGATNCLRLLAVLTLVGTDDCINVNTGSIHAPTTVLVSFIH